MYYLFGFAERLSNLRKNHALTLQIREKGFQYEQRKR